MQRASRRLCLYFAVGRSVGAGPPGRGEGCTGGSEIEPLETVPQGLDQDSADQPFAEPEELRGLIALGRERGYLTFEQIAATLEEVEVTKEQISALHAHLVEHGVEVIAEDGVSAYKEQRGEAAPTARREESRARPDGRTEPRLAAPLPALDRQGRAAHRRPGGRAGEADRARRHARQAADGRGQPAPRRLDRERLSGPRAQLPRPDPGGLPRADPRGREVRLPPRLQVLHLRDLVDPPGGDAGDRRQGADDPHPGPHGREAEPGRLRRAPARAAARPRARAGGDRRRAALVARRRAGHPARRAAAGLAGEAGRRRGRIRARRLRRRRRGPRSPSRKRASTCSARACARRSTRCPSASAR